jgi:hypothetical protein
MKESYLFSDCNTFVVSRTCYGSRTGQKTDAVCLLLLPHCQVPLEAMSLPDLECFFLAAGVDQGPQAARLCGLSSRAPYSSGACFRPFNTASASTRNALNSWT